MIWQLLHTIFGWDYIVWRNSVAQGIARVRLDGMGRVWYWRYRSINCADYITDPSKVVWLTCSPSKYGFAAHSAEPWKDAAHGS